MFASTLNSRAHPVDQHLQVQFAQPEMIVWPVSSSVLT